MLGVGMGVGGIAGVFHYPTLLAVLIPPASCQPAGGKASSADPGQLFCNANQLQSSIMKP